MALPKAPLLSFVSPVHLLHLVNKDGMQTEPDEVEAVCATPGLDSSHVIGPQNGADCLHLTSESACMRSFLYQVTQAGTKLAKHNRDSLNDSRAKCMSV